MSARHPAVDEILAVLPMGDDGTGHVADCGFGFDGPTCGCYFLPQKLEAIVQRHVAAALEAAAEALPELTEGIDAIGTAHWPIEKAEVYSLAIEEAQAAIRSLATTDSPARPRP